MKIDIDFTQKSGSSYTIYIDELKEITLSGKVAIITNPKVAGLHLKKILNIVSADELYIITTPDGESYKSQQSLEYILENLFNHQFDRASTLIAFGGGVIGDMTGFVASIYQRGIDFIQIPTTLLSQVDASVGGKSGINNRFGKNLVGAFYQPKCVYIETEFLDTLPSREFSAGVSEIIKMAVVFDREFFIWLESADLNRRDDLRYAIKKSVEIKAKVVSLDEREKGVRAVLNYGHTFAHVIENLTEYSKYLHGEAVSIGICMANELALLLGLLTLDELNRIKELLIQYNLPTSYTIESVDLFYNRFFLDKKRDGDKIKFILPDSLGGYMIKDDIDRELIFELLRKYKS